MKMIRDGNGVPVPKGEKFNLCMVELCVTEVDETVHYICAGFGERDGLCKFQIVGTEKHCYYVENEGECGMCTNLEAAKDALTRVAPLIEKAQHKMIIYEREMEKRKAVEKGEV